MINLADFCNLQCCQTYRGDRPSPANTRRTPRTDRYAHPRRTAGPSIAGGGRGGSAETISPTPIGAVFLLESGPEVGTCCFSWAGTFPEASCHSHDGRRIRGVVR